MPRFSTNPETDKHVEHYNKAYKTKLMRADNNKKILTVRGKRYIMHRKI